MGACLLVALGAVFLADTLTPAGVDLIPLGLILAIAAAWLLSSLLAFSVVVPAVGLLIADAAFGKIGPGTAVADAVVFLLLIAATRVYAARLHGLLAGTDIGGRSLAASVFGLENLGRLVDVSRDGVAAISESGRILYANSAAADLLGISATRPWPGLLDRIVEADRARVLAYLSSPAEQQAGTLRFFTRQPDGQLLGVDVSRTAPGNLSFSIHGPQYLRVVEVSYTPFVAQRRRAISVVMQDLTEVARLLQASNAVAETAANLAVTQPLERTLEIVSRRVVEVTRAKACSTFLLDREGRPSIAGSWGLPPGYPAAVTAAVRSGAELPMMRAIRTKSPTYEKNIPGIVATDPRLGGVLPTLTDVPWQQAIAIPLLHAGDVLGALCAYFAEGEPLDDPTLGFLNTIAGQVASAVQVSRLVATRHEQIAAEERHRLSRELHDSLSQALYGIVLGATSARKRLEVDPTRAVEPVDYVLDLAEGALADMRNLVLELRPESLEREGLVAALKQHADRLTSRYGLTVKQQLCTEPSASVDTKVTAYRIAQEALHNVVQHAHARNAWLRLDVDNGTLTIEVQDDGEGFDVAARLPSAVGLEWIRERVTARRGDLRVDSSPGSGARVVARLPIPSTTG